MPSSDPLLNLIRDAGSKPTVSQAPQTYGNPTTDEQLARSSLGPTGSEKGTPTTDSVSWSVPLPLTLLGRQPQDIGGTLDVMAVVQVAGPAGDQAPLNTITNSTVGRIVYE